MKRKLLLLIIAGNTFFSLGAQMKWGAKAGANINSRSGYNELLQPGSIFTIQASVFANRKLAKDFIIQPSLGYYGKGFKLRNFQFVDNFGNDLGRGDMNTRFDYLELSLPFLYQLPPAGNIMMGGGPYIACAVAGKNKATNFEPNGGNSTPGLADPDFDFNNRFDAGLTVQVVFRFGRQYLIMINYDQGLIDINKGGQMRSVNRGAGLCFGYIFNH